MNNGDCETDWDDIKVFLEIANTGSLTQAARKLTKSQPTIGRRIEKLENSLGLCLFKRSPYGYELTAIGERLYSKAKNISVQVNVFLTEAKSLQANDIQRTVVITCGESFVSFLTDHMQDFMAQYPTISIDIISSFDVLNLEKGAADIAIRSQRSENPNLITRKLGKCYYAIYASEHYIEKNTQARDPLAVGNTLNWVSYKDDNEELHSSQWLVKNINVNNIKLRCNTASSLLSSVNHHHGLAVLPKFVADKEKNLVQLSKPLKTLQPDIWLVLNRNAHRNSATSQVSKWIGEIFEHANFC